MSIEPPPINDDAPLANPAEPPKAPWAALDRRTQLVIGAGLLVAIVALIGSIVDAFRLDFSGIILIGAGLLAAGAAYLGSTGAARPMPVALRDLILTGGTISSVLGILYVAELAFDLDHLDDYGGIVGVIATVALAIAGIALYVGATRWWAGGPVAPWTSAIGAGGRATRLVLIGAVLVVIGWLGNVTIGFWYLEAGTEVITFILLAALVMRAAADHDEPMRLPFPAAFVSLGLTAIGAIIALQHTSALLDEGTDLDNWIAQLLYVAGVVVALAGAILGSMEAGRTMTKTPEAPAATG